MSQKIPVTVRSKSPTVIAGIVAVTGTNGKTTTAALIGQMFRMILVTAPEYRHSLIPEVQTSQIFVVEVSSFQLEWVEAFHPKVAIITNLAPDHRIGMVPWKITGPSRREYLSVTLKDGTVLNYDDPPQLGSSSPDKLFFSADSIS